MKIEILYVAECPSHSAAVKLVRDVLSSEGLAAEVRELLIIDETVAAALGFRGSPTIRIDGRDVVGEPAQAEDFGLSCRLYPGSTRIGVPPADLVRRAVVAARKESRP
jgi:hypothetical protein